MSFGDSLNRYKGQGSRRGEQNKIIPFTNKVLLESKYLYNVSTIRVNFNDISPKECGEGFDENSDSSYSRGSGSTSLLWNRKPKDFGSRRGPHRVRGRRRTKDRKAPDGEVQREDGEVDERQKKKKKRKREDGPRDRTLEKRRDGCGRGTEGSSTDTYV